MRRTLNDVLDISLHQVGQLRARRLYLALEPFMEAVGASSEAHRTPTPVGAQAAGCARHDQRGPELLERVLQNLVGNAVEHGSADGSIAVEVSWPGLLSPGGGSRWRSD